MKKFVSLFTALCLTWITLVPISAEQNNVVDPYNILSVSEDEMTIQFYEEDVIYDFAQEDNKIIVSDHLSGEVVFVSTVTYYDSVMETNLSQVAPELRSTNYENWNTTWSEYRRGHIQLPSPGVDNAVSLIAGLLLSGAGMLGIVATQVLSIAILYRDRSLDNAYFIQYYRTNLNCGILAKTYSKYYTSSNYSGLLGSSPEGYMWTDSPWNYSHPAPCRVLVNNYPA